MGSQTQGRTFLLFLVFASAIPAVVAQCAGNIANNNPLCFGYPLYPYSIKDKIVNRVYIDYPLRDIAAFNNTNPTRDTTRQDSQYDYVAFPGSFRFVFYGSPFAGFYLGNDGVISFRSGVASWTNTAPIGTATDWGPLMAPFFADVDTRNTASGIVYYRIASDAATVANCTRDVRQSYLGASSFTATFCAIVTWDAVGYSNSQADKKRTFQVVMISDGTSSYVLFNYARDSSQWTQAQNMASFGKWPDVVFDKGDAATFLRHPWALTSQTINLWNVSNTIPRIPGRLIYKTSDAIIGNPPSFLSNVANLTALGVSTGILSPAFNPRITQYTLTVNKSSSLSFRPVLEDSGSTVQVDGVRISSGSWSVPFTVTAVTSSQIAVTAVLGNVKVYRITILLVLATDSRLSALSVQGFPFLEGAFVQSRNTYTISLTSSTPSLALVTATPMDNKASVSLQTTMGQYGPSAGGVSATNVALIRGGLTLLNINCTAEDGITRTLFLIRVNMTLASNAGLQRLTNGANLIQSQVGSVFTINARSFDNTLSFTANASSQLATVSYGAQSGIGIHTFAVALAYGTTTATFRITAENGIDQTTWTLNINRPKATDNSLRTLSFTDGYGKPLILSPTFSQSVTTYTTTAQSFSNVVVTYALLNDTTFASMTLNGALLDNNVPISTSLNTNPLTGITTVLSLVVSAHDGSTRTYSITVTKPAVPSISLSSGCTSYSTPLLSAETRHFRLITPALSEILHVSAQTNVSSAAPRIWIRRGALPDVPNANFLVASLPSSGQSYSDATLMFAPSASDYYISVSASTFSAAPAFSINFRLCSYTPQNASLFANISGTVTLNEWTFYQTFTTSSQYLPSIEYLLAPRPAAVADINVGYLQTFAAVVPTTTTTTPPESFFSSLVTASNPIPGANMYQTSTPTPPPRNSRIIFGVFAVANGVANTRASYGFSLVARPPLPAITLINPLNGPTSGGNVITLTGNNFEPVGTPTVNAVVFVGNRACTALAYDPQGRILCTTPPGDGVNLAVNVTFYSRTSAPFGLMFSYDDPTIFSINPSGGPTIGSTSLVVSGQNFGFSATVTVGNKTCVVSARTPHTSITCSTPPGEGSAAVVVTAAGQVSLSNPLFVYDAPLTTSIRTSNAAAQGGNPVTIIGSNFGSSFATVSVTIGGQSATPVTFRNQTMIIATVPAGTGSADSVVVSVNGRLSNGLLTFAYDAPVLFGVLPNPVPVATTRITVLGKNFGPPNSAPTVNVLGGVCQGASVTNQNDTFLTCTTPARSSGAPVPAFVTVGGQSSNTLSVNWAAPRIDALTFKGGDTAGITKTTIVGLNLASPDVVVTLNGLTASITGVQNNTHIGITIPAGQGINLPLLVAAGGQQSNGFLFNYSAPFISSVTYTISGSPSSGAATDGSGQATFTGQNLGSFGQIVFSNGQQCNPVTSWQSGFVVCTVPAGSGSLTARAIVSGQVSPSVIFTYAVPIISSVTPSSGVPTDGSLPITITGLYFAATRGSSNVTIRGQLCSVVSWSDTSVTCNPPAGNGTSVPVIINVGGLTASSTFRYLGPTISSAVPQSGTSLPTSGGVSLQIAGISLDTSGRVTVGGVNCPVTYWTHTLVRCTLPAGGGASQSVILTTSFNLNSTAFPINYDAPSITSIIPNRLGTAGQSLTLVGSNLGNVIGSSSVAVTGVVGTNTVTFSNHTHLFFTLAATPTASLPGVTVTYRGQTSSTFLIGIDPPVLSLLSPSSGPTGPTYNLTLIGQNFGDGTLSTTVTVGANTCPTVEITPTRVICRLPSGTDTVNVIITVGSQSSASRTFQYTAPSVVSVSPTTLLTSGSQPLTILGSSFGTNPTVTVGGVACPTTAQRNHTFIVCTYPFGLGSSLPVVVTVGTQSSGSSVTVSYENPRITSVSPNTGGSTRGGSVLVITGSGFGPGGQSAGFVTVGGAPCPIVGGSYGFTSVQCTLPAGSGVMQPVIFTVGSVSSSPAYFNYSRPSISGISPSSIGTAGGQVVISGSNFATSGTVSVNGTASCVVVSPSDWSDSAGTITCTMPAFAGTVTVTVTAGQQISTPFTFTYTAPSISGLVPSNGPTAGGYPVTINGANFFTSGVVTIDGLSCVPTGWTHSRIVCLVPGGVGDTKVLLVRVFGQQAQTSFVYDAPVVTGIQPAQGPTNAGLGGSANFPVVVSGLNFGLSSAAIAISIGGVDCASVSSHNHTHAVCSNVPNGVGTNLAVRVRSPGNNPSASVNIFSYRRPVITSISGCTNSGSSTIKCPISGGTAIFVNGTDFGPMSSAPTISVNGLNCSSVTYATVNGDSLRCILPALQNGLPSFNVPVIVTVGGQSSVASTQLSYAVPTISANSLWIQGYSGFGSKSILDINGTQVVQLKGEFFSPSGAQPTVKYGTADGSYSEFTCTVVSGAYSDNFVNCTLQNLNVGKALQFIVTTVVSGVTQTSAPSTDTLTLPVPALVGGTIGVPSGNVGTFLPGSSTQGEIVQFDATGVGSNAAYISVTYAQPGQNGTICDSVSIDSYDSIRGVTRIQCRTQTGFGQNYYFKVSVLGHVSAAGTDAYSYPQPAVVKEVKGCTDRFPENTTYNCPTAGNVKITLVGDLFTDASSVTIGGTDCVDVEVFGNSKLLTCTLAAGTGQDLAVVVFSANLFSQPVQAVSYKKATLSEVSGCSGSGSTTTQCARAGGTTITLTGDSFGKSGANVFVSGLACASPQHVPGSEHTKLTCVLPPGTTLNAPILLLQQSGTVAANSLTLSYLQCSPGTYQANSTDYPCSICPPGTYSDVAGAVQCTACPSGRFGSAASQSSCAICDAGSVSVSQGAVGPVNCTLCAPGTFSVNRGQDVCSSCAPGTYAAGQGSTGCITCPVGQVAGASAATTCTNCTVGSYAQFQGTDTCTPCTPGRFAESTGSSTCLACAIGTAGTGATCAACGLGYAQPAVGQAVCVACEAGSFSNATGSSACFVCPAGYFSQKQGVASTDPGATSCLFCAPGRFADSAGLSTCSDCPLGAFSNMNASTTCTACAAGTVNNVLAQTTCTACAAGEIASASGLSVCTPCPEGSFSSAPGQSECQSCSKGNYSATVGSTVCSPCPVGKVTAATGQSACSSCDVGKFAPLPGLDTCTQCSAGTVAGSPGSSACTACDQGKYAGSPGLASCTACVAGYSAPSTGMESCQPCSPGYASGAQAVACVACTAGKYASSAQAATCTDCPGGRFSNSSAASFCYNCESGSFQNVEGRTVCTVCPQGKYVLSTGQSQCIDAPAGSFVLNSGASSYESCPVGSYQGAVGQSSCVLCPVGKAASVTGSQTCTDCSPGFYSPFTGQSSCLPCDLGSFAPTSGLGNCTACAAGTYADAPNSQACTSCPAGSAQANPGRSTCDVCAAGSVQANTGRIACDLCAAGTFSSGTGMTACSVCAAGSYSSSVGLTTCAACPAGSVSGSTFALAGTIPLYSSVAQASSCTNCSIGTVRQLGSLVCTRCTVGSVQPLPGQSVCQGCPAGYVQPQLGQSTCNACAPGTSQTLSSMGACDTCLAGTYSNLNGSVTCTTCPVGYACPTGATSPVACGSGTYSAKEGASACSLCEEGKFQENSPAASCQSCPAGRYNRNLGVTACALCAASTYSSSQGVTSCTSCSDGTYSASGFTTCNRCPAGSIATSDSLSCSACAAGKFSSTDGSKSCTFCPVGTYGASSNMTACIACPVGSYQPSTGKTECIQCESGRYINAVGQAACIHCDPGFYSLLGASTCTQCALGRYSIKVNGQGATACADCDLGTYAGTLGQSVCQDCPVGYFGPSRGLSACEACAVGQYNPSEGAQRCLSCPSGAVTNNNASILCTPCSPGSRKISNTTCNECASGFAQPATGADICNMCPTGTYTPTTGQLVCVSCALGTAQPLAGQNGCPTCLAGTFANSTGLSNCYPCPQGQFASAPGQSRCLPCASGFYAGAVGSVLCSPCPAGSIQPGAGKESCVPCAAGEYIDQQGQTKCNRCPIGTFANSTGLSSCFPCSLGRYSEGQGATVCTLATPGFYVSAGGQTSATLCAPGSFSNMTGASFCSACARGKFQNQPGGSLCTTCSPGQTNINAGETSCFACPSGYFTPYAGGECQACPMGTYQSSSGGSSCTGCSLGYSNPATGQSSCVACSPGTFQNTNSSATCSPCPPGTFTATSGLSSCTACSAGFFASSSGFSVCAECDAGTYQDLPGQSLCSNCAPGSYSSSTNSREVCLSCPRGTFAALNRSQSCVPCAEGSYNNQTGQTSCIPCPLGSFVRSTGSFACELCPQGQFSDAQGQSLCRDCPAGTSAPLSGTVNCTVCTNGTYQAFEAQPYCVACEAGKISVSSGAQICAPCKPGQYLNETGKSECKACPPGYANKLEGGRSCDTCEFGKYAPGGASMCLDCGDRAAAPSRASSTCYACDVNAVSTTSRDGCLCNPGYSAKFAYDPKDGYDKVVCFRCPDGAVCDKYGTIWANMSTSAGWWSPAVGTYYRCLLEQHCVGGPAPLTYGEATAGGQCTKNRYFVLCSLCLPGYSETIDGTCRQCGDRAENIVYVVGVCIIFFGLLILQFYIMLRSGEEIMDIADREDEKIRRKRLGYVEDFQDDFLALRSRYMNIITIRGPPPPKPDFTFKLKILLGFLQIISNLAVGFEIQWPDTFKRFVNVFSPLNMDFVKFSSVDCLTTDYSYVDRLIVFVCAIPALIAFITVFYFLPAAARQKAEKDEVKRQRGLKRVRRNFWKLVFFALFLLYPSVSAVILRIYVCRRVGDIDYLQADFTLECYTSKWTSAAYLAIPFVIVYPLGIPLFFMYFLLRYRKRLHQSGVRAELGFLYDAYEREYYYFELIDLVHKLVVTSIIAYIPWEWQMASALVVVVCYMLLILVCSPYLRKGDDRLHLFAQLEICLAVFAGMVFNRLSTPDSLMDKVLSVVLVFIIALFFAYFLAGAWTVAVKLIRGTDCGQRFAFIRGEKKQKRKQYKYKIMAELAKSNIDRSTLRGQSAQLEKGAENMDADAAGTVMARNPLFLSGGSAGNAAYDEVDRTEVNVMVNPIVVEQFRQAVENEERERAAALAEAERKRLEREATIMKMREEEAREDQRYQQLLEEAKQAQEENQRKLLEEQARNLKEQHVAPQRVEIDNLDDLLQSYEATRAVVPKPNDIELTDLSPTSSSPEAAQPSASESAQPQPQPQPADAQAAPADAAPTAPAASSQSEFKASLTMPVRQEFAAPARSMAPARTKKREVD